MQNSLESPPCAAVHHSLEHETRAKRHVEKVIARILHKMHSASLVTLLRTWTGALIMAVPKTTGKR
jgi:hypothetical protein